VWRTLIPVARAAATPVAGASAWRRVFLTLATVVVVAGLVTVFGLRHRTVAIDYNHAARSVEMAFNWLQCGRFSSLHRDGFAQDLLYNPGKHGRALIALAEERQGSVERYCAGDIAPIKLEDSGLMYLDTLFLRLMPRASVNDLFVGITALMLASLVVLSLAMLRAGLGPLVALGSVFFGIVLYGVEHGVSYLSNHAFMWPPLFGLVGGLSLVSYPGLRSSPVRSAGWLVLLGMLAGVVVSLRYSYLPYVLGLIALHALSTAAAAWRTGGDSRRRGSVLVAAAPVLVLLGFVGFDALAIAPLRDLPYEGRTTHPVFHPLVLGLAVPPNRLAEREGIDWRDSAGRALAERGVGVKVTTYEEYEHALGRYYRGLWRSYPSEMAVIYLRKAHLAGVGNVRFLARLGVGAVSPFILAISGYLVLVLLVVFGVRALGKGAIRGSAADAIVLAVVGIGVLAWIQMALVFPAYSHFFPEFLFVVIVLTLVFWSNVLGAVLGRSDPGSRTIQDFGEQWSRYPRTGGYFESLDLLADILSPFVALHELKGKRIVEIGSGAGRIVSMLMRAGADHVVAVEPSPAAMNVLRQNTVEHAARITCLQVRGDAMPATGEADLVLAIGVLHHIPDPLPVARAARGALRPGGRFVAWLYGREGHASYVRMVTALRAVTRHSPDWLIRSAVVVLDVLLVSYMAVARRVPVPLGGYLVHVVQRLTPQARRLVIYDQLKPAYARYYCGTDAERLLLDAGFADIRLHHRHGYSWVVTGIRPNEADSGRAG
jgi:SAM-dependent methyltransferase